MRNPCDSVGVDVGSLPGGVRIIDIDNTLLAGSIREYLEDEMGLPRGENTLGRSARMGKGIKGEFTQRGNL